ncbi:Nif3-like dinuclear metal center hexameric protein (plasmid) [Deinococcus sp. KNUC1210]|uniref:Nif3-like dinuclear metal center hexameric protein n=1 Tax=Deinococcus sp. KNUC1210 TaxID=2917691 RepID=UPI001EF01EAD|nr:Nif3-like dinuclear metal center hexameric protein [Deinococcus sp. KNUC1210]ULH17049.1 Nif3-like dinuclear metal center hexameric protein [Deinococcus sp. KNUC1210]
MSTLSIQNVIDTVLSATNVPTLSRTADTFKTGDPNTPLTSIVTTFLATAEVIREAAAQGANLIVTHEPTFYSAEDTDDLAWLDGDPTYEAKRRMIEEHGIVIWRFHDYWHMMKPDGILTGVAQQLGWTVDPPAIALDEALHAMTAGKSGDTRRAGAAVGVATIPEISLLDLARHLKEQLGATAVRMVGPDDLPVRRVGLTLGALPGKMTIAALQRDDVDIVLTGETREWETCEFLRDAEYFGCPKGMLVVGHATSEEAGMAYLADWLRGLFPDVQVTHLASGDPFRTL